MSRLMMTPSFTNASNQGLIQTWSVDRNMWRTILVVAVILMVARDGFSQSDIGTLIAEAQPAVQDQIDSIYKMFLADNPEDKCKVFEETQKLKDMAEDKGEIVKQLAIFIATTTSEEDIHLFAAGGILEQLQLPSSISIRVLAPYVDADNEKLRAFAHRWFQQYDSHDRIHGRPPLGSVNYYDYMQYVRSRLEKNEEIPAAFVKYIYEKHPGKALLVFAHSYIDFSPAHRHRHLRRETELAERIVSNAIWLNENGFAERFQAALPETNETLATLAKHKEWWARLYVAEIMRQHPELRQTEILKQLSTDSNALVSKAAQSFDPAKKPGTD